MPEQFTFIIEPSSKEKVREYFEYIRRVCKPLYDGEEGIQRFKDNYKINETSNFHDNRPA